MVAAAQRGHMKLIYRHSAHPGLYFHAHHLMEREQWSLLTGKVRNYPGEEDEVMRDKGVHGASGH